jgi:putative redox protein
MIVTFEGDSRFAIRDHEHVIPVESPAQPNDVGLEPVAIFSGAVGACVGYYVLAYCRKHDLDPTGLHMEVTVDMAEAPRRIGSIATRIIVPAHIAQEHFAGMMAYAKHCLLHQTLLHTPALPLAIVSAQE